MNKLVVFLKLNEFSKISLYMLWLSIEITPLLLVAKRFE